MRKRVAIKEMLDQVHAGNTYTMEALGEPIAVVIPWEKWIELKQALVWEGVAI